MRRRAALVLGAAALLVGSAASADEAERCASASEEGQALHGKGQLRAARTKLLICASATCPAMLRRDCERELAAVEESLPTVVIRARDQRGRDLVDVRVQVDGTPLATQLTGKAIAVDPGVHVFRFERDGSEGVERRVVVQEAQKNRPLDVVLSTPDGGDAKVEPPPAASGTSPTVPASAWVTGGLGLGALGVFAYLAASGQATYDRCERTRACPQSDLDALGTQRTIAFTALGVGVVSIGVAVALVLARPPAAAPTARAARAPLSAGTLFMF